MAWTRERRLGALGGAGGVLVGAVVAVTLAVGGSGDGGGSGGTKDPPTGDKPPATGTSAPEPAPEPGPDPLCVAHEELVATLQPVGAVEGPDELETTIVAQEAFHTTAAGIAPEPGASTFRSVAGYYGALRAFYAERGWRPDAGRTDFGSLPAPPADGSLGRASDIVAARCNLSRPTDTPTPDG